jgi:hypothetical protein
MENMRLTPEEKAAVEQYLKDDLSFHRTIILYWPYIIPSAVMAGYGFIKKEYIAVFIAFVLLLAMAFWFLYYSGKAGKNLQSALKKYHQKVSDLNEQ